MSHYHKLYTAADTAVVFIDHQPQMTFGVANIDRATLINNVTLLAKVAKKFGIPAVLTAVETESFSGYIWPQLLDVFPGQPVIGTVESFSPASGAMFSLLPPQNATGNFTKIVQRVPVRIGLPRGSTLAGLLRPGLSVVVSVDTRGGEGKALVASSDSLLFGAAQASTGDRLATGESR